MAINFVNINKTDFLKNYERIYRFINLERFMECITFKEFVFVNPVKWSDPYEKFFIERDFQIESNKVKLPMKDSIFSVCASGTLSSEAYWKVYAPKEDGIRITINTEKFLTLFLERIKNCELYIGKVNYQIQKEFFNIKFDSTELIQEIESNHIGEQQISFLLKKRKSFSYEDEIRIIVVPNKKQNDSVFKVSCQITDFASDFLLDPRIGKQHGKILKDYFKSKYNLECFHSRLYDNIQRKPIILKP